MNKTRQKYNKKYKNNKNKTKVLYGGMKKSEMIPFFVGGAVKPPVTGKQDATGKQEANENTNSNETTNANENTDASQESQDDIIPKEGIVDMATDALKNSGSYVAQKIARMLGYEPINSDESNDGSNNQEMDNMLSNGKNIASKIATDILHLADDTVEPIIDSLNDLLGSTKTGQSLSNAGNNVVNVFYTLLKDFNDSLNRPLLREQFEAAINILAEYAKIFVGAMDGPLDETMDLLNKAVTKAVTGLSSGAIKVASSAVSAVPYVGSIVGVGEMVNNGSKAVGSVFNAGTEAVEAVSLFLGKTSENIKKPLEELEEKQKESAEILSRTQGAIQDFKSPLQESKYKGGKTYKKYKNRNGNRNRNFNTKRK